VAKAAANMIKKIFPILTLAIAVLFLSGCSYKIVKTDNEKAIVSPEPKTSEVALDKGADFLNKYNLYYFDFDNAGNFVKNGEKIEKGGDKFTPDFLYSDGSFLSSYSEVFDKAGRQGSLEDTINSSLSQNDYKLFFQGNIYESSDYSESVLRDRDFIYYKKCLKVEYSKKSNGNRCVNTALYSNNDKIDEGGRPSDLYMSTGVSNIDLLFVKNGILYYGKTIGEKYDFYSYDPIVKKVALYKPELFSSNENDLLGIFDNGDIIFDNSDGIFKNNSQSKIIDSAQIGDAFLKGMAIGNSYYYFNTRYDQKNYDGGHDLFKDSLLISKINNSVYGRTIDADKQDCHFSNYIFGYSTLMYCINKSGAVVRLDSKSKNDTKDALVANTQEYKDVVYIINNDVVDFSPYWITGGNTAKSIRSASFVFDDKGGVSYLVIEALDEKYASNIYLVPYLGDGKIGEPQILISNASLFGVVKK
jgi:hypothetical protein